MIFPLANAEPGVEQTLEELPAAITMHIDDDGPVRLAPRGVQVPPTSTSERIPATLGHESINNNYSIVDLDYESSEYELELTGPDEEPILSRSIYSEEQMEIVRQSLHPNPRTAFLANLRTQLNPGVSHSWAPGCRINTANVALDSKCIPKLGSRLLNSGRGEITAGQVRRGIYLHVLLLEPKLFDWRQIAFQNTGKCQYLTCDIDSVNLSLKVHYLQILGPILSSTHKAYHSSNNVAARKKEEYVTMCNAPIYVLHRQDPHTDWSARIAEQSRIEGLQISLRHFNPRINFNRSFHPDTFTMRRWLMNAGLPWIRIIQFGQKTPFRYCAAATPSSISQQTLKDVLANYVGEKFQACAGEWAEIHVGMEFQTDSIPLFKSNTTGPNNQCDMYASNVVRKSCLPMLAHIGALKGDCYGAISGRLYFPSMKKEIKDNFIKTTQEMKRNILFTDKTSSKVSVYVSIYPKIVHAIKHLQKFPTDFVASPKTKRVINNRLDALENLLGTLVQPQYYHAMTGFRIELRIAAENVAATHAFMDAVSRMYTEEQLKQLIFDEFEINMEPDNEKNCLSVSVEGYLQQCLVMTSIARRAWRSHSRPFRLDFRFWHFLELTNAFGFSYPMNSYRFLAYGISSFWVNYNEPNQFINSVPVQPEGLLQVMITPEQSVIDNIEKFGLIVHIKRGRSQLRTYNYFETDRNLSKGSCASLRDCAEMVYEIYQLDWYRHIRIKPELIIELSDLMANDILANQESETQINDDTLSANDDVEEI